MTLILLELVIDFRSFRKETKPAKKHPGSNSDIVPSSFQ